MRRVLLVALTVAAPVLFMSNGVSACGWGCDCAAPSYGYSSYGYAAPRVYGYSSYYAPSYGYGSYYAPPYGYGYYYGYGSYYRPGVRFYGARAVGWRAGVGIRRVGWRGGRRW